MYMHMLFTVAGDQVSRPGTHERVWMFLNGSYATIVYIPPATHNQNDTQALPVRARTRGGVMKIPMPIILLMIKANTPLIWIGPWISSYDTSGMSNPMTMRMTSSTAYRGISGTELAGRNEGSRPGCKSEVR